MSEAVASVEMGNRATEADVIDAGELPAVENQITMDAKREAIAGDKIGSDSPENISRNIVRDCAGTIACASCFFASQCPRSETGKALEGGTEEYSLEKLLDDEDSLAEMTPLIVPGLLPSVEKTPESETSSKEAPVKDNKTPIVRLDLTPKEQKMAGAAQPKTPEVSTAPTATISERQNIVPQPEVETPKEISAVSVAGDVPRATARTVDRSPKFEPSNTPTRSDAAITVEQKSVIAEDIRPTGTQQTAMAVEASVNPSPIVDTTTIIAVESNEANVPTTHETSRQVSEMPADDSEISPHIAPPVAKSVHAAVPTTVEISSQESCEPSKPVILHQDAVNEIEAESIQSVDNDPQVTPRNHHESAAGSLVTSPLPLHDTEVSAAETDSKYSVREASTAPKQIDPEVVPSDEQLMYVEFAVASQEKAQDIHNVVVKTTPFHAPPTTLDIAPSIVNTLDLGLSAAAFEMGEQARPLSAPVDPPNLRNNLQPEFLQKPGAKPSRAISVERVARRTGVTLPTAVVVDRFAEAEFQQHPEITTPETSPETPEESDEILLTDTQEPEPANQGYGISGFLGELSELIGKLACAVAVNRQRLRSEYDLIA